MAKAMKAGILGAIVLFIWGAISWMVLPWHMATLHSFTVDRAVTQSIESNAPHSGIYLLPSMYQQDSTMSAEDQARQPMVFAAISLQSGQLSMTLPLIISFLTQLFAACFVAWLLLKTHGLSYLGRLGFVMVFALAAGCVTHLPYWNWFGFDWQFTIVQLADLLIGWFLAGLVLAKFCKTR